ncbi:hypothetical protein [Bosea sp. AAP35]|uniref:hypothetical protein n=1 Tax=Bosea sp. AAP35 TaxID=1523417 RepID=UPI000AE8AF6E|nr:hypothetical protein [Bosea sp. AAP35]
MFAVVKTAFAIADNLRLSNAACHQPIQDCPAALCGASTSRTPTLTNNGVMVGMSPTMTP